MSFRALTSYACLRLAALFAFSFTSLSFAGAAGNNTAEPVATVAVGEVVRATLRSYVTGYGQVETAPDGGLEHPAGGARLAAGSSGLVVAVSGIEGADVERGAVLVQLDSSAADAAVARAQAAVDAASKARSRQQRLEAVDGTSERALQESEERLAIANADVAAARLEQVRKAIRAPLAGTVAHLDVKPGEWLDAGKEIGEIVDLDRLVLTVMVSSSDAATVRAGQPALVFSRLEAAENLVANATVHSVAPRIVPGSDAVTVRLALPAGSGLRPGQFLGARIVTEERAGRLAVPRESVYTNESGQSTLSIVEGDVARRHTVQTGLRDGDLIEVSGDGLAEGVIVATIGSFALPDETRVRIVENTSEGAK